MHSWDNWKGQVLHETPLQDGEAAARLLSYYAIPKTHPIIEGYVKALRDEDILKEEFSYIPPEIPRFEKRYLGLNNGGGLMVLIYTCQALMDMVMTKKQSLLWKHHTRLLKVYYI